MTTSPQAPQTVSGGIVLVDPNSSRIDRVIVLQYNPDTLSRTLQVQGAGAETGDRLDVLRLKGWAALPGSDARLAIQAVGPRVNAWFDRPWKPGEPRETALVVIGESPLDHDAIRQSLMRASRIAA